MSIIVLVLLNGIAAISNGIGNTFGLLILVPGFGVTHGSLLTETGAAKK